MRFLFGLALCLLSSEAVAQSALDLGGIELRLGQRVDDALRALSAYRVRYDDGSKMWIVVQGDGRQSELLGTFSATNGSVSYVAKAFAIPADGETPNVYSRASRELRRRGGTVCASREVEFTDGLIRELETRCGLYRLTYSFPWKSSQDTIGASVSLMLKQP